jgi:hypothetical protein
MKQLNVSLGENIRCGMRSMHTKFKKFMKYRGGDMNLSSFSFSEFCTLEEQKLARIAYMKDVVLYEGIPIKFILYI